MNVRRIILTICFLAYGFFAKAQHIDTLIFTWNVNANVKHTVCMSTPPSKLFTVYWGDGTNTVYQADPPWMQGLTEMQTFCHKTYSSSGTYIVTIVGSPTAIVISRLNSISTVLYNRNITHIDVSKAKNLYEMSNRDDITTCVSGDYSNRFVPDGQIGVMYDRLRLTKLDTIKPLTFAPHNPVGFPQWLEKRIITCETIDWSSEAIITSKATGQTGTTLFQVFKKDYTIPFQSKPELYADVRREYILPVNPGDYTETGGIFTFHNPGDYLIKMSNPVVRVHSTTSPNVTAEVYQEVLVLPYNADTTKLNAVICKGGSYKLNGFNESQAGTYYRTTQKTNGCDSVIMLNLSHYPIIDTTRINAVVCKGNSYTQNGFNESQAGTYYRTAQSINGCDSVIKLTLAADLFTDTINAAICQGDTYNLNGFNENQTGIYQQNLKTAEGCDSSIVLNLTVNPVHNTTIYDTITCEGSYNFFGQNLTDAGTYTHTLTNQYGCDSIIELVLSITPIVITPITASICQDTFYYFGGKNLTVEGIYYDTVQAIFGCDSIVELTLNIDLIPDFEITTKGFLCNDNEVELTAKIDDVSYQWNTGETSQRIYVLEEGTYLVEVAAGLCKASKEIEVFCPCKMRLPNLFTPKNGEYVYIPEATFELHSFSMIIYNRWGGVVFQTNQFTHWNGKTKGQDVPAGVYYCVIEYSSKTHPEKKCTAQSSITVLR